MASTTKYIYSAEARKGLGVGGIAGDRFSSVAGWEHGTVGFAGNIYSRLASENGIQPVDPAITSAREPFRVGRFMLKLLRTVPFFDTKVTAAWRYIIEDTATEFSGIQSYQFDTFQKQHGVIRQNVTYTGIYKETNGEFTIKVPETAGQLVRKSLDYWFYGMSDPKTGVAHFYGKDMRDLQENKSMTILYVLLGPTCRPYDIEYAAIYHQCVCTSPRHDHVNAGSLGEAGSGTEHDLTFSGIFDRGPEVDRLAAVIVDREGLYAERSQNALLPGYIYKYYLGGSNTTDELSDLNTSMLVTQRFAQAVEGGENFGNGDTKVKGPTGVSSENDNWAGIFKNSADAETGSVTQIKDSHQIDEYLTDTSPGAAKSKTAEEQRVVQPVDPSNIQSKSYIDY